MHEYTQDAMSYDRHYSRSDLFVTFTIRCWMHHVEWQKLGLPHAHILVYLLDKIRPDEIDSIILAEIPDETVDPKLHAVATKHMILGLCELFNYMYGKCSERYPRDLLAETITGNDG
ncbi:hypothetical protein HELRODRAFT_184734 [Helobdella robusta]|uniref:Helitron helicase-like domain-containing protein n=1 Tax=Helobdella robusta TaxID=6412 RepID=T1FLW1_HELRO|nr:hypothetical protein HELRODRAFT_184734 [Helobdella robusta]XP_009027933.1 hypothetical protein HELRODRAFT_180372 [Helobdella robusta]ESN93961.1 hypothetical protein HELRODRAFT_180372 [Helobdella robusta]ESO01474.1 hypothetical protein HELRODRAFT_184734 [Helobdella robusta]